MAEMAVPIGSVMKKITLEVRLTGLRTHALRMWLGLQLLRWVGFVVGTGVTVSIGPALDFDEVEGAPGPGSYVVVGKHTVPMACSIDPRSPLYDPNWSDWGPHVDIYLDGARQKYAIAFDVDAGCVRTYRQQPDGELLVEDGEVKTEVRRGRVELRPVAHRA